jgi:hypothetical protein
MYRKISNYSKQAVYDDENIYLTKITYNQSIKVKLLLVSEEFQFTIYLFI